MKNNDIIQFKLFIEYTCPTTNEIVKKELTWQDFSASESECDLCGSHGSITIWMNECPSCNKPHNDIEVTSW